MNTLYKQIAKYASFKYIIFFLFLFVISNFLINGNIIGVAKLNQITNGVGILDMSLYYTPDSAYAHLNEMGNEGRDFYSKYILPQDFVFPFIYTGFFLLLNTYLIKRVFKVNSLTKFLSLVPLIGGVCDYLENIGFLIMLKNFPTQLYVVPGLSVLCTFIKFKVFIFNIALVVFTALLLLLRGKKSNSDNKLI